MPKAIVDIPDKLLAKTDGQEIKFDELVELLASEVIKKIDHREYLRRYNGKPPSPYDLSRRDHPAVLILEARRKR